MAELIDRGARVLDVSADHRLHDAALYPPVYGFEHPRPDLLAEAVYGLPERHREDIRPARLVANPGCFPEASILALLPLAGELADVVIDSKSGVSGAGRTPTATVHYSHAADNVSAYKVYAHRHRPRSSRSSGVDVTFTPHLVPVDRGLLSTCYARLTGDAPAHRRPARALPGVLRRRTPSSRSSRRRRACAPCSTPTTPRSARWSIRAAAA